MTDATYARRSLSLHAVFFGQVSTTSSLRRMAQIALEAQKMARAFEAQKNAPDSDSPQKPTAAILSSYTEAIDSVRWPSVFIALSLISIVSGRLDVEDSQDRRVVENVDRPTVFIFLKVHLLQISNPCCNPCVVEYVRFGVHWIVSSEGYL